MPEVGYIVLAEPFEVENIIENTKISKLVYNVETGECRLPINNNA